MGPVNLASVFLAVMCCSAVLSFKTIREKPGKDSLIQFSQPSKSKISSLAKRRVRRESNDDHPDVFNANKKEGPCNDPTNDDGRTLQTFDVSWAFQDCSSLYSYQIRSVLLCLLKFRVNLYNFLVAVWEWDKAKHLLGLDWKETYRRSIGKIYRFCKTVFKQPKL